MQEPIEIELLSILHIVAHDLPEGDVLSINELIRAREWGVGFENLCTQLYEYDVNIPRKLFDRIEKLGRIMELEDSIWRDLQELTI